MTLPTTMSDLKPCPFCQGTESSLRCERGAWWKKWWLVRCPDCGGAGESFCEPFYYDGKREQWWAVHAWNKRGAG